MDKAVGSVLETLLGSVLDILWRPGPEKDCLPGFDKVGSLPPPGETKGVNVCQARMPAPFVSAMNTSENNRGNGIIWMKPGYRAENQTIATGKNCPVGSYPFDGLCYKACPNHYTRELVPGTGTEKIQPKFRCMAECKQGWHKLDWVFPGDQEKQSRFGQEAGVVYNEWCYHQYPAGIGFDVSNPSQMTKALNAPFNLKVTFVSNRYRDGDEAKKDNFGAPLPGGVSFEAPGVYAQRVQFPLGPAELPTPCVAKNQVTASQRCVRPCAPGHELVGENCLMIKVACPTSISIESDDKGFCIPKVMPVPRYPGILVFLGMLSALATAGVVTARIIRSSRRDV